MPRSKEPNDPQKSATATMGKRLSERKRTPKRHFDELRQGDDSSQDPGDSYSTGSSDHYRAESHKKKVKITKSDAGLLADENYFPEKGVPYFPLTKNGIRRYEDQVNKERKKEVNKFVYQYTGDEPSYLFICTIAAINQYGIITTQAINKGTRLTKYLGQEVEYPLKESGVDRSYFFLTEEHFKSQEEDPDCSQATVSGVDARDQGNWARIVNGTEAHIANIRAELDKETGEITYYTLRNIEAGEQLLIHYGLGFSFPDKCYLKPTDNWQDSSELLEKYADFYKEKEPMAHDLQKHLNIKGKIIFFHAPIVQPIEDKTDSEEELDEINCADFSIFVERNNKIMPQAESENLTNLMLACWNNNQQDIENLIANDAELNTQTSKSGETALHLLIHSPRFARADEKLEVIEILLRNNALLNLRDKNEQSALTVLIEMNTDESNELLELLMDHRQLLTRNNSALGLALILSLVQTTCFNEAEKLIRIQSLLDKNIKLDSHKELEYLSCPILSSIASGQMKLVEALLPHAPEKVIQLWAIADKRDLFSDAIQELIDSRELTNVQQQEMLLAVHRIISEMLNDAKQIKKTTTHLRSLQQWLAETIVDNYPHIKLLDDSKDPNSEKVKSNSKRQKTKHQKSSQSSTEKAEENQDPYARFFRKAAPPSKDSTKRRTRNAPGYGTRSRGHTSLK